MLLPILFISTITRVFATIANQALEKKVNKAKIEFLQPFIEELEHVFCMDLKYNTTTQ